MRISSRDIPTMPSPFQGPGLSFFFASMSALCFSNSSTVEPWPFCAAKCRAVQPRSAGVAACVAHCCFCLKTIGPLGDLRLDGTKPVLSNSECCIFATESCWLAPALGALSLQISLPHTVCKIPSLYRSNVISVFMPRPAAPLFPLELPGRHSSSPRCPLCASATAPRWSRGRFALRNAGR